MQRPEGDFHQYSSLAFDSLLAAMALSSAAHCKSLGQIHNKFLYTGWCQKIWDAKTNLQYSNEGHYAWRLFLRDTTTDEKQHHQWILKQQIYIFRWWHMTMNVTWLFWSTWIVQIIMHKLRVLFVTGSTSILPKLSPIVKNEWNPGDSVDSF